MADPTPTPEPVPADPSKGRGAIALIALLLIVLAMSGNIGGTTTFKAPVPAVFCVFPSDASSTVDWNTTHPGQGQVITSQAPDSVRSWVTATQGGVWVNHGDKDVAPTADAGQWVVDAYNYWIANGKKVPYMVAGGPSGTGYAGDIPDTQDAAKAALKPIAVK